MDEVSVEKTVIENNYPLLFNPFDKKDIEKKLKKQLTLKIKKHYLNMFVLVDVPVSVDLLVEVFH